MASIRNVQWARLAVVLVASGVVAACLQALPVITSVHEALGTRFTALASVGLVLFTAVTLFPVWWPWWRAHRACLSRPWLFVLVVCGFSNGVAFAVFGLVAVPAKLFQVFLLPQLVYWGTLSSQWSIVGDALDSEALIVALLQIVVAIVTTRVLARRWGTLQPLWDSDAA
jgi:hypothetical protein